MFYVLTEVNQIFSNLVPQLKISGYQYPLYHTDRNNFSGGKIVFLREGLTARKPRDFERDTTEAIFLELAISNKTWFFIFACRPPISNNKNIFFSELSSSLDRATATMKYDTL